MVEATSTVPVLLACFNSKCERVGMQLPYYFTASDLPKMMVSENSDVIMCPACGETRTLTPSEKEGLRHLVSHMGCDRTDEINQELESVRTKLQDAPTPELRAQEEVLTKKRWDHEMRHNSGIAEDCKKK